ncbi:MAG: hypothetical protein ACI4HN_06635 [Ruminococcus sp.]
MTDITLAVVIGVFFLILAERIIKLFLNLIAVKTVSVIYKKTDKEIFSKTITRAFLFGLLADFIAYVICTLQLIFKPKISCGNTDYWTSFLGTPLPYDFATLVIIIIEILISMVLTFLFSYFKVLFKTDLPKKQMLLSSLIITLITAPYYFLIRIIF